MSDKRKQVFYNSLPDFDIQAEEEKRLRAEPKKPTFSLEDMEDARKSSYDKGHADGLQIAKDSIEQKTEILVQSIIDKVRDLEKEEKTREERSIENSIAIASKSLHRLLPAIISDQKKILIQNALTDFFKDHIHRHNLTLFTHPDMIKPVEKYIAMLSADVLLQPDEKLSPTQLKLSWVDGSFEFKPDQMVDDILKIIGDHVPEPSQTLDDSTKNTHTEDDNITDKDS